MSTLRRHLKRAVYRATQSAVVLIYHRVARLEADPQLLAVTPEHFDAQMAHLAAHYRPVSLDDLVDAVTRRRRIDGLVAVTFDDGYADNLHEALPLLEKHGVPATFFVSSGYAESGVEFWWDELERSVLGARAIGWDVTMAPRDDLDRRFLDLAEQIRPLSAPDRERVLARLRGEGGGDTVPARASHRPMTADEVARLCASPLASVGGHTVSHQELSARTLAEQREEIAADRASLAGMCDGSAPTAFSYPYGGLHQYTDASVVAVREAGYRYACSNHPGTVKRWTDPYRIPRRLVRDWDEAEFAARMQGFFRDGA